jgi:hypothetical protein
MGPVRESIAKGVVSPRREVPAGIAAPEYVGKKAAARWKGGDVPDAETVERIRVSGRIAAQALADRRPRTFRRLPSRKSARRKRRATPPFPFAPEARP